MFIDNESFNNYKMFNRKYQDIRMQSIIFVTLRKPNKTEVLLTKKYTGTESAVLQCLMLLVAFPTPLGRDFSDFFTPLGVDN